MSNNVNSTSITFIDDPKFTVDFKIYAPKNTNSNESSILTKVKTVVEEPFRAVIAFFQAAGTASYQTIANSKISFQQVVLGYYRARNRISPPQSLELAVVKTCFWLLAISWNTAVTTNRLFQKIMWGVKSNAEILSQYNNEINMNHIRTNELNLDASSVPDRIKIEDLLVMYDKINFNKPEAPGYMDEKTRKDSGSNTPYDVAELRTSLETFVDNVVNRNAFLGTPLSYDTERLMNFYQQIESAVRLCMNKIAQDITTFEINNGSSVHYPIYTKEQKKEYNDLIETQSRLVLDLAIAGKHCGARYMGDAMNMHSIICEENLLQNGSLEENIVELLAQKRLEIARGEIQTHFFQRGAGVDTHSYNKYMSKLGETLGLPGTKNIIEHLDNQLNKDFYLKKFFEKYTVNTIIDTIQDKFRTSQSFRENIYDWVKNQKGDWKPKGSNELSKETSEKIEEILTNNNIDISDFNDDLETFYNLVDYFRQNNIPLPAEDWPEFWTELFGYNQGKKWLENRYSHLSTLERFKKLNNLRLWLSKETLGNDLYEQFYYMISKGEGLNTTIFKTRFEQLKATNAICKLVQDIQRDTILRHIIDDKKNFLNAINESLDIPWRAEFLDILFPYDNELTSEMIEWLLVSQNILIPQNIK